MGYLALVPRGEQPPASFLQNKELTPSGVSTVHSKMALLLIIKHVLSTYRVQGPQDLLPQVS